MRIARRGLVERDQSVRVFGPPWARDRRWRMLRKQPSFIDRGRRSLLSWNSLFSALSILSLFSFASIASIASSGSVLSIGSNGSLLSIGSAGSILSIGSAGSILSIGAVGGLLQKGRRKKPDKSVDLASSDFVIAR